MFSLEAGSATIYLLHIVDCFPIYLFLFHCCYHYFLCWKNFVRRYDDDDGDSLGGNKDDKVRER